MLQVSRPPPEPGWWGGGWNDGFHLQNETSPQSSSRKWVIHVLQLSSFHRYEEPVRHHANTNDFVNTLTRDTGILSRAPPEENVSGRAPEQESSLKSSILVEDPLPRDSPHPGTPTLGASVWMSNYNYSILERVSTWGWGSGWVSTAILYQNLFKVH